MYCRRCGSTVRWSHFAPGGDTVKQRVAVVTGGGSGIGAAVCRKLVREGLRVAVVDRNLQGAQATVRSCFPAEPSNPETVKAFQADVVDRDQVEKVVRDVAGTWGRLDVLVNVAGIVIRKNLASTDPEDWNNVLNVNLTGTFNFVQMAIPLMIDTVHRGLDHAAGRVINVASCAGEIGFAYPAYTASKGGIIALTRELAAELSPHGITVNAVSPGFIRTPINDDTFSDPKLVATITRLIPVGRLGTPEDVAEVVAFLASPGSGFINGENIRIDGGMTSVLPVGQDAAGSKIANFHGHRGDAV